MAWIELHQSVWTHRKTFLMSAALGVDDTAAVGHLARLWCWGIDNAGEQGELTGLPDAAIALAAGWKKKPDVFVAALVSSGYVDDVAGVRALHDWDSYAGRLLRKRAANAQRARTSRTRNADVAGLPYQPSPSPSPSPHDAQPRGAEISDSLLRDQALELAAAIGERWVDDECWAEIIQLCQEFPAAALAEARAAVRRQVPRQRPFPANLREHLAQSANGNEPAETRSWIQVAEAMNK